MEKNGENGAWHQICRRNGKGNDGFVFGVTDKKVAHADNIHTDEHIHFRNDPA
jgi:hypothetical protein